MLCTREYGQCVKGMCEDVVGLPLIARLAFHELLGGNPVAIGGIVLKSLRAKEKADFVVWIDVIFGILGDDDHHRTIVVVAMAEGLLAIVQLVEVVDAPIALEVIKAIEFHSLCAELEDVFLLWLEVAAGKEMQEGHWQTFAIAPLEVIDFVEASATAALDL